MREEAMFDTEPSIVEWSAKDGMGSLPSNLKISAANADLYRELLAVTARYLDNLTGGRETSLRFSYRLREDGRDYLKLDVLDEMMVVGILTEGAALSRFLQTVERAYQLSQIPASEGIGFVPIIFVGEHSAHAFYIESMRGFPSPTPFFIRSAIEFLGRRIVPRFARKAGQSPLEHLANFRNYQGLPEALAREPMIRGIIEAAPASARSETVQQIAAEIAKLWGG
jgi:hypothetical protein